MGSYVNPDGAFDRDTNYIEDRILANPEQAGQRKSDAVGTKYGGWLDSDLSEDAIAWPVEANRYRLVAAPACPWANRTLIVRKLLGLEEVISVGLPGPTHDARSWTFDRDPEGKDPILGTERLQENYFKRFPDYPRGITVPAIVDVPTGKVVTNDFKQITIDFSTQWKEFHKAGAPDLFPKEHLEEMFPIMDRIFHTVNNGVYKAGFAGTQEAYEKAYNELWESLDWLEDRLSTRRYLMGDKITEADIRLFTTLARFDAVYHGHFKTNRQKLTEMPNLWGYARDLYQTPGFGETVDFQQIKDHYYIVHTDVNPTKVVPLGPDPKVWHESHNRAELAS